MKLAFVLQNFDRKRGGAERYIVGLAEFLAGRGHALHVFSATYSENIPGVTWRQVPTTGGGAAKLRSFSTTSEAMLRAESFDAIQGFEKTLYMDVFQPHSGVHRASIRQNLLSSPNPLLRALRSFAKRWSGREKFYLETEDTLFRRRPTPVFVALSNMVKGHMQSEYQVPESQIRLIYNGTDLDRFDPSLRETTGKAIRAEQGIGNETVFLFVSLNYRRKGLHCFLKGIAGVQNHSPDASFKALIVGRGDDAAYATMARNLGIQDRVIFAGEKPNIRDYYLAGDVFVLPTYYDPCALVNFEALASGLPVITTRHNGAGEIMEQGRQGFVISEPDDIDALTKAMRAYLDPDELKKQRAAAIALASEYPIERSYTQMEALYAEIAAGKAAPVGARA